MFSLADGEMIEGMVPKKGQALVKEFILHYQKRLYEMWEKQNFTNLAPLK